MTDHRVDIDKLVKDPALHPAAAQSPAEQPRDVVWAFPEADGSTASESEPDCLAEGWQSGWRAEVCSGVVRG